MLIRAYGDPSKLIIAMEAQGLALWTEDGEHWLIATPSTAQGVRSRSRRGRRGIFGENENPDQPYYPASLEDEAEQADDKIESRY